MLAAAAGGTQGGRTIVLTLLPATTLLGGKKQDGFVHAPGVIPDQNWNPTLGSSASAEGKSK